jgi:hypothetical protein
MDQIGQWHGLNLARAENGSCPWAQPVSHTDSTCPSSILCPGADPNESNQTDLDLVYDVHSREWADKCEIYFAVSRFRNTKNARVSMDMSEGRPIPRVIPGIIFVYLGVSKGPTLIRLRAYIYGL